MTVADLLVGVVSDRHFHSWVEAIYDVPNYPSDEKGISHSCHLQRQRARDGIEVNEWIGDFGAEKMQ